MDYIEWFYNRLTQLRLQKGVSARDMSLSVGQSESYINKIENRRTLPSFSGFLYICEYFEISPQDFFSDTISPKNTNALIEDLSKLNFDQTEHVHQIIKDIIGNK